MFARHEFGIPGQIIGMLLAILRQALLLNPMFMGADDLERVKREGTSGLNPPSFLSYPNQSVRMIHCQPSEPANLEFGYSINAGRARTAKPSAWFAGR